LSSERFIPANMASSCRNWEVTAPWHDEQIHQPSLFIAGAKAAVMLLSS